MESVVYVPVSVDKELPDEEGYYYTRGKLMATYWHNESKKWHGGSFVSSWLKPIKLSELKLTSEKHINLNK